MDPKDAFRGYKGCYNVAFYKSRNNVVFYLSNFTVVHMDKVEH